MRTTKVYKITRLLDCLTGLLNKELSWLADAAPKEVLYNVLCKIQQRIQANCFIVKALLRYIMYCLSIVSWESSITECFC